MQSNPLCHPHATDSSHLAKRAVRNGRRKRGSICVSIAEAISGVSRSLQAREPKILK